MKRFTKTKGDIIDIKIGARAKMFEQRQTSYIYVHIYWRFPVFKGSVRHLRSVKRVAF